MGWCFGHWSPPVDKRTAKQKSSDELRRMLDRKPRRR